MRKVGIREPATGVLEWPPSSSSILLELFEIGYDAPQGQVVVLLVVVDLPTCRETGNVSGSVVVNI